MVPGRGTGYPPYSAFPGTKLAPFVPLTTTSLALKIQGKKNFGTFPSKPKTPNPRPLEQ